MYRYRYKYNSIVTALCLFQIDNICMSLKWDERNLLYNFSTEWIAIISADVQLLLKSAKGSSLGMLPADPY
jgi:hypothetical protein